MLLLVPCTVISLTFSHIMDPTTEITVKTLRNPRAHRKLQCHSTVAPIVIIGQVLEIGVRDNRSFQYLRHQVSRNGRSVLSDEVPEAPLSHGDQVFERIFLGELTVKYALDMVVGQGGVQPARDQAKVWVLGHRPDHLDDLIGQVVQLGLVR